MTSELIGRSVLLRPNSHPIISFFERGCGVFSHTLVDEASLLSRSNSPLLHTLVVKDASWDATRSEKSFLEQRMNGVRCSRRVFFFIQFWCLDFIRNVDLCTLEGGSLTPICPIGVIVCLLLFHFELGSKYWTPLPEYLIKPMVGD